MFIICACVSHIICTLLFEGANHLNISSDGPQYKTKYERPFAKFYYNFKGCIELENSPRMFICREIARHR